MRLSDLSGKEIINLGDGSRLGVIDECDLVFDDLTGNINALVVPKHSSILSLFRNNSIATIPWHTIKRIGDDVIIVDFNNVFDRIYSTLHGNRPQNEY